MKIWYDNNTRTVTIENVNKYFSSGSLIAVADGDNVSISYLNNNKLEIYSHFSDFQKSDGSQAGANVTAVVDYLNSQFNRGIVMGVSSFSGLGTSRTINDSRIQEGDIIMIQPIGLLNEVIGITVANGAFTVTRSVIAVLTGLTNNLNFFWVRM